MVSIVIATSCHGGSIGYLPFLNMVLFCDGVGIRELVLSVCTLNIGLQCSTAATCLPYNEILGYLEWVLLWGVVIFHSIFVVVVVVVGLSFFWSIFHSTLCA